MKPNFLELDRSVQHILNTLDSLSSLKDKLEVIANVLIRLGLSYMSVTDIEINPENVVEVVLNNKKINGETLPNSIAQQGLIMLMWLKTE